MLQSVIVERDFIHCLLLTNFRYVNPPTALQTPYRQLSWLYLCFINSWLLLSPSRLLADWRFGAVPVITSVTDPHNILTLSAFAAVTLLAVYCLRGNGQRQKMVLFGLSLLVLPYIPASNLFFPVGFVVAERVLYLPSMGFSFLVGFGVWQALKLTAENNVLKTILRIGIAYLLAVHSSKTLLRNRDWYSGFLLYSSGIQQNPKSGIFLSNLGIDYAMMKNYSFAEQLFRSATEVAPYYSKGFFHLGKVMFLTNRYKDAEEVQLLYFKSMDHAVCILYRQIKKFCSMICIEIIEIPMYNLAILL